MNSQPHILITGATSGIGWVAACELASKGAKVIATARSAEKAKALIDHYQMAYPHGVGTIETIHCDLSSFESAAAACELYRNKYGKLDTLMLNAGIWNFSFRESKNGIEEILQVNVLAPVLMVQLLKDMLAKSSSAKVIFTASALHMGPLDFNDPEHRINFSGFKAYSHSKLSIILMTRLLAKTLSNSGIGVYAQHPGLVNTELGRDASWSANLFFRVFGISAKKGAQTMIYLASTPKNELSSGAYYTKSKIKTISAESSDMKMAEKLKTMVDSYLEKYLKTASV